MSDTPPTGLPSLLSRRLIIVTGKGGTGKTSVVAALGLAAARAGRRTLVVETGRDEAVSHLIAPAAEPVGYGGRELAAGLRVMHAQPYEALAEYLAIQLHTRTLVNLVLRNAAFRQLMDAAPGWRELITLGKIWHLGEALEPDGSPSYDLILVDAPATGHGITFLDVPRVVVSAVQAGPLRRHAGWVEEMIRDRERTLLLPVALAEELPTRETTELVERLRERAAIVIDRVVANAVMPAPFPPDLEDLPARLERLDPEERWTGLPSSAVLAACARHLRERHELNRRYVTEIAEATGLPVVELPFLDAGVRDHGDLETLGKTLLPGAGVAA